jgi:Plasmid pRiA4b ORF-3-like protein
MELGYHVTLIKDATAAFNHEGMEAFKVNGAELHEVLQNAFGWSGEHLHRFLIHGAAYGISCLGGIVFPEDARRVSLSRFRLHSGERFRYEYDFLEVGNSAGASSAF